MLGNVDPQGGLFCYVPMEGRTPADRPLLRKASLLTVLYSMRPVRGDASGAKGRQSPRFVFDEIGSDAMPNFIPTPAMPDVAQQDRSD